jgi:hypothetical protein
MEGKQRKGFARQLRGKRENQTTHQWIVFKLTRLWYQRKSMLIKLDFRGTTVFVLFIDGKFLRLNVELVDG